MRALIPIGIALALGFALAPAADLVPLATGDSVSNYVAGRINMARDIAGSTAIANLENPNGYWASNAIDGILDWQVKLPWLPTDHPEDTPSDWLVVDFHQTMLSLDTLVLSGSFGDNTFHNRSSGLYTFLYSTDSSPLTQNSAWTEIGTYVWTNTSPMPRTAFSFPIIVNVTGIELLSQATNGNNLWRNAVQEYEAYAPIASPPVVITPPASTNLNEGDSATLTVATVGGQAFQWYKNGGNLTGANGTQYRIFNAKTAGSAMPPTNALPTLHINGQTITGPAKDSDSRSWLEAMRRWREQELARMQYNGREYDRPELAWTRTSFIQAQMMVEDRYFYDPDKGCYTVDRYLDDLETRYGGLDSVLIWPVYPNVGIDNRNQHDMLRAMPGDRKSTRLNSSD